jgi:uncharacterized protein YjdB/alpha-tubulin suppressor-like RCC1 family protein
MKNHFLKLTAALAIAMGTAFCGGNSSSSPGVTGVTISQASLNVEVNQAKPLSAAVQPADALNRDVAWTSSDNSVATVRRTGLDTVVVGVSVGRATITVRTAAGGHHGACAVTVTAPTIHAQSVSVSPKTANVVMGQSVALSAAVHPADADDKAVAWSSSDAATARVSPTGPGTAEVTCLRPGPATITATTADGGLADSCLVIVLPLPVPVAGLTVDPAATDVPEGGKVSLTASVAPANAANRAVAWRSSSPAATVASTGLFTAEVTGVMRGQAVTITATALGSPADGPIEATCAVTVVPPVLVTGVTLEESTIQMPGGTKRSLTATVAPADATNKGLRWTTSDASVARVSGEGATVTITAGEAGEAMITVTTVDQEMTAVCAVAVTLALPKGKTFAAGDDCTLAIRDDGSLWAWGWGNAGRLGTGSTGNQMVPVQIGEDNNWWSVACGEGHSLGIRTDGTLWAWGSNGSGQLGIGSTAQQTVPVRVGTDSDWLLGSICGGSAFSLALKADGSLWSWGLGSGGQLGHGDYSSRQVPTRVGTDSDWAGIGVGGNNSLAIKKDGTLWAWGNQAYGKLGNGGANSSIDEGITVPTQIGEDTNWSQMAIGTYSSMGIKKNGTLWACGYGNYGLLGVGDTTNREEGFVQVGTDADWDFVSVGGNFAIGVKYDGSMWTWGRNNYLQQGREGAGDTYVPTRVNADTDWAAVSAPPASAGHGVALKIDGGLWLWGRGAFGVQGNGGTANVPVPTLLSMGW